MFNLNEVCAVDVGFGYTKYQSGNANGVPSQFPSVVAEVREKVNDISVTSAVAYAPTSDTVLVTVGDGGLRRVGPSIFNCVASNSSHRILDPNYSKTKEYLALLRGALTYMNVTRVPVLVLSLPLSTYKSRRVALASSMQGTHSLFRPTGEQYICNVQRVEVVPQPIAAYFHYLFTRINDGKGLDTSGKKVLLIDVGFYTIDWVVAQGMNINAERSAANNGGMNYIVKEIAEEFTKDYNDPLPSEFLQMVDDALANQSYTVELYGKRHSIKQYLSGAERRARLPITALKNSVGDTADISDIVVCGGGATFFAPIVREMFKNNIVNVENSQFAIVSGMRLMALEFAKEKKAVPTPAAQAAE